MLFTFDPLLIISGNYYINIDEMIQSLSHTTNI